MAGTAYLSKAMHPEIKVMHFVHRIGGTGFNAVCGVPRQLRTGVYSAGGIDIEDKRYHRTR